MRLTIFSIQIPHLHCTRRYRRSPTSTYSHLLCRSHGSSNRCSLSSNFTLSCFPAIPLPNSLLLPNVVKHQNTLFSTRGCGDSRKRRRIVVDITLNSGVLMKKEFVSLSPDSLNNRACSLLKPADAREVAAIPSSTLLCRETEIVHSAFAFRLLPCRYAGTSGGLERLSAEPLLWKCS